MFLWCFVSMLLYVVCSLIFVVFFFFFSSRRRHTRCGRDWSSDVCSSDLAPGLWALADETRLEDLLADAGLGSVRRELLDDQIEYGSVDQLVELTGRCAGPARAAFASLDDDGRAAITSRVAERTTPYRREDGTLAIPERMVVASARRRSGAARVIS